MKRKSMNTDGESEEGFLAHDLWQQKQEEWHKVEASLEKRIEELEYQWNNRHSTMESRLKEIKLIAEKENHALYEDTKSEITHPARKSLEKLSEFSPDEWLSCRNTVLVEFINEITKSGTEHGSGTRNDNNYVKKICLKMCAVETIMKARNLNYVSEFGEALAAVEYAISGSKLVLNMEGHTSANGSYSTLMNWMEASTGDKLDVPTGDIVFAFDNEQKLKKAWLHGSMSVDAITTVICAQTDSNGILQQNAEFKPEKWTKDLSQQEKLNFDIMSKDVELAGKENLQQDFQGYITVLKKEWGGKSKLIEEHANDIIRGENMHQCLNCSKWWPKNTCKCSKLSGGCDQWIKQTEKKEAKTKSGTKDQQSKDPKWFAYSGTVKTNQAGESYVALQSEEMDWSQSSTSVNQVANSPLISLSEPIFVNPNSFDSIIKILRSIGERAGVKQYGGNIREWVTILCDGLPYGLVQTVIDETKDETGKKEFGWVHLLPGLLHEEMNMLKSFVELNWEITYSQFGKEMGYKSERAAAFFKSAGDHHKSWYNLCIYRDALALELLRPYVNNCLEKQLEPTVDGFFTWKEQSKDATYQFHCNQLTQYLQAIFSFRKGVRENNHYLIQWARKQFYPLWAGRGHTKYNKIHLKDATNRLHCPPEVLSWIQKNESFSQSKHWNQHQGLDAVLEEFNKEVKGWIGGVPEKAKWQMAVRMLPKLNLLRKMVFKNIGLEDPSSTQRNRPENSKEVFEWRAHIRNYLQLPDLIMRSISKEVQLCQELVDFTKQSKEKWWGMVEGSEKPFQKVFITIKERQEAQSDERKTKDILIQEIEVLQAQLPPVERKKRPEPKKLMTKAQIILILQQLRETITQRLNETIEIE